ncbi:MAG: tyrosine-type recombinase/integrase, partial [Sutterella wadsworthensis]
LGCPWNNLPRHRNPDTPVDRPLNPWTVGDIVKKYKSEAEEIAAGLKTVTTHDLRRTFATRLLEKNVDITTVKNLMGHSSITTTTLYDRRGDEAMRRATKEVDL